MRKIRTTREDEMIAAFLYAEYYSPLTAYLIASECLPIELEVIVGFSEQITQWGCY